MIRTCSFWMEPVSGIDQNGMDLFYHTISELKKHYDLAIILISHDLDYVAQYADQVILIDGTVKNREPCVRCTRAKNFDRCLADLIWKTTNRAVR